MSASRNAQQSFYYQYDKDQQRDCSHSFNRGVIGCASLIMLIVLGYSPITLARTAEMQPSPFLNQITGSHQDNSAYINLVTAQRDDEIKTLKAGPQAFTPKSFDDAKQSDALADNAWLKASGVDFKSKKLTQQGVALLQSFSSLPQRVLDANMAGTVAINDAATEAAQAHAVADAFDLPYLHFMAEGLGPHLGKVFLEAYQDGKLGKAAALIKASELSTSTAKNHFNYTRPFLVEGNKINLVPDRWIFADKTPYTASKGSFPSGHTNGGQTDALLLAEMLPERFASLVARGDGYGYSRLIVGVHYPLDVIGSRMHAEMVVSHYLSDPAYRKLFDEAKTQLRTVLEQGCGTSLEQCAAVGNSAEDPWASAAAQSFHRYTLDYGLPAIGARDRGMQVPKNAEVLLEGPFPNLSVEQRRALLQRNAARSGSPLDEEGNDWQRIDLIAAYQAGKGA